MSVMGEGSISQEEFPDEHSYEEEAAKHKARRLEALKIAVAEADKGIFISGEAVEAWVRSWDTENELPPPEPDIFPTK
ncbi:hypothetical protein ACMDCR_08950 [Labrys okinawensis]|uniref:hypothetical protein n=1 Tax=Labrys okinawensis TaxID=346911 RepID=UPI0039BC815F